MIGRSRDYAIEKRPRDVNLATVLWYLHAALSKCHVLALLTFQPFPPRFAIGKESMFL